MGRRAGSERRGAVIIETALVTPLLLVIVLGIVEMALLMRDDNALSSYVRDGGRAAAAAVAGESEAITPAADCTGSSCAASSTHWTDTVAAAFTSTEDSSSEPAVDELWVYHANRDGYPGAYGRTGFDSCAHACVVYRWSAEHHAFEYASGSWSDDDHAACDAAPDSVGIYARSTHSFLSKVFSDGVRISDHTVFSLASACSNRSS